MGLKSVGNAVWNEGCSQQEDRACVPAAQAIAPGGHAGCSRDEGNIIECRCEIHGR